MGFGICSLASSSAGNSYMIKNNNTVILLDCGISVKKIKENLLLKGVELSSISAILITHEHVDHVKSLKNLLKKVENCKVYMSKGTMEGIKEKYEDIYPYLLGREVNIVSSGMPFYVDDIMVSPFNVSHDTNEPLAFSFRCLDKCVSVVTDTGIVTEEIFTSIKDSDVLVIESNHEPEILLYGRYPYKIKQRILSDYGHLSNESCGELLKRILLYLNGSKVPKVYLAHLSEENNTPEQAILTIGNYLFEEGLNLEINTLRKDEASKFILA